MCSTVVVCSRDDVAVFPCCSRRHICILVPIFVTVCGTVVVCEVVTMSLCFRDVPDVLIVGYLCHHVFASTVVVCVVVTMSPCFRAVPDPGPNPSKPMSDPGSLFLSLVKSSDARPLIQNIIMNVNYNNAGKTSGDDEHAQQWH